jgi:hypothetical protein
MLLSEIASPYRTAYKLTRKEANLLNKEAPGIAFRVGGADVSGLEGWFIQTKDVNPDRTTVRYATKNQPKKEIPMFGRNARELLIRLSKSNEIFEISFEKSLNGTKKIITRK